MLYVGLVIVGLILMLMVVGFLKAIEPIAVSLVALFGFLNFSWLAWKEYFDRRDIRRLALKKERERLLIFIKTIGFNLEIGLKGYYLMECEVGKRTANDLSNKQIIEECERINFAIIRHNSLIGEIKNSGSSLSKDDPIKTADKVEQSTNNSNDDSNESASTTSPTKRSISLPDQSREYLENCFQECLKILTLIEINLRKYDDQKPVLAFKRPPKQLRQSTIDTNSPAFKEEFIKTVADTTKILNDKFSGIR